MIKHLHIGCFHGPLVQVNTYEIVVNFISGQTWYSAIVQNLPSLFNLWTDKTIHVNLCKDCAIDLKKRITCMAIRFNEITFILRHKKDFFRKIAAAFTSMTSRSHSPHCRFEKSSHGMFFAKSTNSQGKNPQHVWPLHTLFFPVSKNEPARTSRPT